MIERRLLVGRFSAKPCALESTITQISISKVRLLGYSLSLSLISTQKNQVVLRSKSGIRILASCPRTSVFETSILSAVSNLPRECSSELLSLAGTNTRSRTLATLHIRSPRATTADVYRPAQVEQSFSNRFSPALPLASSRLAQLHIV